MAMDSQDSWSTVAASGTALSREGQSVDDDRVAHTTCALAKDAVVFVYFQGQKYAECLDVLKLLLLKKPGDPNKRSEDLARKAEDSSEAGNNNGIKSGSISKENTLMPGSEDSDVYICEFDTMVASLNIAMMICYHLHDYGKALSILEPLFQSIETR